MIISFHTSEDQPFLLKESKKSTLSEVCEIQLTKFFLNLSSQKMHLTIAVVHFAIILVHNAKNGVYKFDK